MTDNIYTEHATKTAIISVLEKELKQKTLALKTLVFVNVVILFFWIIALQTGIKIDPVFALGCPREPAQLTPLPVPTPKK